MAAKQGVIWPHMHAPTPPWNARRREEARVPRPLPQERGRVQVTRADRKAMTHIVIRVKRCPLGATRSRRILNPQLVSCPKKDVFTLGMKNSLRPITMAGPHHQAAVPLPSTHLAHQKASKETTFNI